MNMAVGSQMVARGPDAAMSGPWVSLKYTETFREMVLFLASEHLF